MRIAALTTVSSFKTGFSAWKPQWLRPTEPAEKRVWTCQKLAGNLVHKHRFPGVDLLVTTPTQRIHVQAGHQDLAKTHPMTPDTPMYIGSISKLYTAVVVLQLQQEGKLRLDDRLIRWFPWERLSWLPHAYEITLKDLLQHTSGIPEYFTKELFTALHERPYKTWRASELLRFAEGKPKLVSATGHAYSNTNYLLLGLVIEAVTGKPLGEVYQERIFTPLNLRNTSLGRIGTRTITPGYGDPCHDRQLAPITDLAVRCDQTADGGILSTVSDMERFIRALFEGNTLLTPESQRLLYADPVSQFKYSPKEQALYGLGLMISRPAGKLYYGHDGVFLGYQSVLQYYPESKTVVVVLENRDCQTKPSAFLKRLVCGSLAPVID